MNIQEYVGKELLGWIYYNENYSHGEFSNSINRVCYVYPRYIISGEKLTPIDPADFPQLGSFEVRIQGGFSAEEIVDKLTHLVSIRINVEPELDSNQQNNFYRMKFNPSYGDDSSEVWLERFRNEDFFQVINTDDSVDSIIENRKLDYVLEKIYTKYIVIKTRDGIVGPFNYFIDETTVELISTEEYDYNIIYDKNNSVDNLIFKVGDKVDNGVFLITKSNFNQAKTGANEIDFISDEMLIENILHIFEREESINTAEVNSIKKAFMNSIVDNNLPQINEERIERVRQIIKKSDLGSDFLFKIANFLMNDTKLQDYIIRLIIDNRFDEIESRLQIFIEVREKIAELNSKKDALEKDIERLSVDQQSARDFLVKEHEELAENFNRKIKELEEELAIKRQELADIGYLNSLDQEKRKLEELIENDKQKIDSLDKIKIDITNELKQSIDEYKNVGVAIAKELRRDGMDEFISTIKGLKNFNNQERKEIEFAEFNSKDELMEYIYYMMNFEFNHNISRVMVANLVVLYGMSFITNFIGETGSGKTSTITNFAKALGLNEENGLFIKVNIDPDIRSPRDLIGFYNPISGELTANNKRLLNLLENANESPYPYIALFDNANLSMPEHYLSSFLEHELGNNDYINLGGGKEILISDNLRIYTTLQNDHTSLSLSSRYYDKTATISSKIDSRNFYQKEMDNIKPKGVIKMSDLMSFQIDADMSADYEAKLNSIINIFKRYDSPLSARTIQKTKRFITSINPIISSNAFESKYLPLELAVMQFMIAGRSANNPNKRLIESLIQESKNMPLLEENLTKYKDEYDKFIVDTSISF